MSSGDHGVIRRLTVLAGAVTRFTYTVYVTVCPGNAYLISGSALTLKFQAKAGRILLNAIWSDRSAIRVRAARLLFKVHQVNSMLHTLLCLRKIILSYGLFHPNSSVAPCVSVVRFLGSATVLGVSVKN